MGVMYNMINIINTAANSLQSCPTLCDPMDGSPPGSPVPGILQARTLEWVAISFSNAWKWKVKVKLLSRVRPSAIPWTAAFYCTLYNKVVKRVNPKSSQHKKKVFFFLFLKFLIYRRWQVVTKLIVITISSYRSQAIILYSLNLNSLLYLNTTRRNNLKIKMKFLKILLKFIIWLFKEYPQTM